ncbi:MAG: methylenetetrahydrofolate reductase [Nanoarchaeota archaeon]|nr:methylenetetrahydrofolate reductase [Nanoarchaeota archaeon]MBU1027433.1 methylenetetrahydrofolate reductase [Nanoarchaeota archaeon]
MKVIDHIKRADSTLISFEITPPKREGSLNDVLEPVERLQKYNPSFIDVTYHPIRIEYEENEGGIEKILRRKNMGTRSICSSIQRSGIDAVSHVLCRGFTKGETEEYLRETQFDGINNILVVQGDDTGYRRPKEKGVKIFEHSSEMIPYIKESFGNYFCIGVAGYPEKHYCSPNPETDLKYLKQKVDTGADYIVTQMVFDNKRLFEFIDKCRKNNIEVPIIPGLKPILKKSQFTSIPKNFYVDIPLEISEKIDNSTKEEIVKIGIEELTKQAQELINNKFPVLHFFVYEKQDPEAISQVLDNLNFKKS